MRQTIFALALLASGAVAHADLAEQCQSYLFEPPGPEYLAFGTGTLDGARVVIGGFVAADPRQRAFVGRSHIYTRINTAAGTEFGEPYVLHDPYGEIDSGFGRGPSLVGTELVIGAPGSSLVAQGQGAAYVYELVGEDWLLRQQLTPPRDDEALAFGYLNRRTGNRLAIAAAASTVNGAASAGIVYTYVRNDDGNWLFDAALTAPMPTHGGGFGGRMAEDDTVLFISSLGTQEVFPFCASADGWVPAPALRPPARAAAPFFGYGLAARAGWVAVGARNGYVNGVSSGAVFIYLRAANTSWTLTQVIEPPLVLAITQFGASCAFSDDGTRLFIGAPLESTGGPFVGAIHVYDLVGELWEYSHTLYGDPPVVGGFLGWEVVVDGDHLYSGRVPGDTQEALLFSGVIPVDCNDNGVADGCDIDVGGVPDEDGDGVPDDCERPLSPADLDGNGAVNGADLAILLGAWGTTGVCGVGCNADLTGDGTIDSSDLAALVAGWTLQP